MDTIKFIPDEDAILSIDFLAGFTIFILALVMVITLVPGFIAGIQSDNIDYDAVAYRTSVILVEDPGAPDNPAWSLIDVTHKDEVQRLGLTVSKDTPNILSREKVDKFFNSKNDPDFWLTADDYRDKVIFGELLYLYNISLRIDGESEIYYAEGNDPVPTFQYGYMRRLVKVKEPSVAEINSAQLARGPYNDTLDKNITSYSADFAVNIPYDVLIDRSVNPAYRIDPQSEPLTINLKGILPYLNTTGAIESMKFTDMKLYKQVGGGNKILIPGLYPFENDTYRLTFNGSQVSASGSIPVSDGSEIKLVLYPPLPFSSESTSSLSVNFTFSYEYDPTIDDHSYLTGIYPYDYNADHVKQPELNDAVMEVVIW